LRLEADSNLSAPNVLCRSWTCRWRFCREILSDFARNENTVDLGCVHMLIYNARMWRRLRALWSYNELGLTNHSVFLDVIILEIYIYICIEHCFTNIKFHTEWSEGKSRKISSHDTWQAKLRYRREREYGLAWCKFGYYKLLFLKHTTYAMGYWTKYGS